MRKPIRAIDLFAGCGGLSEGFEASGKYSLVASVEWEKAPRDTLAHRLQTHWGQKDAQERTLLFDMQDSERLFDGWKNDPKYGSSCGLDRLIGKQGVDIVIGGPPCQAYSIAGRIRDENGMRDDYRNYLFESYLSVIKRYRPKAFIFENVPGLLSARPDGTLISKKIQKAFEEAGWIIPPDLKIALVNMADYGVPQKRQRLIILGLSKEAYGEDISVMHKKFYTEILPSYRHKAVTVSEAISDLPKIYPVECPRKGLSHKVADNSGCPSDHIPRFHNQRDTKIFALLAEDLVSGRKQYVSSESLKELYTKVTGKQSNIHKYHVLRGDEPSSLIPAHLYKDGLRHIHPDPQQARTITVREAARLQGFPDDYEFLGSSGDKYRMIGNAVPPSFAKIIGEALFSLLTTYR